MRWAWPDTSEWNTVGPAPVAFVAAGPGSFHLRERRAVVFGTLIDSMVHGRIVGFDDSKRVSARANLVKARTFWFNPARLVTKLLMDGDFLSYR